MVTVSHLVKKIVNDKPFLEEALSQKLISYGNLAEQIKPKIEEELGKEIKLSAIVMALRRYSDEIEGKGIKIAPFDYSSEITMKTNLCDFCVVKSPSLLSKLKQLYGMVNFEHGDTLNIVLGNYEVSIVINERHKDKLAKFLKGEKILSKESNLAALTIAFKGDFLHTPGIIFSVVRKLAWENINIYEVVSTLTELTLIMSKKDSIKAYDALYNLVSEEKKKKSK
jgi:aspartokinase